MALSASVGLVGSDLVRRRSHSCGYDDLRPAHRSPQLLDGVSGSCSSDRRRVVAARHVDVASMAESNSTCPTWCATHGHLAPLHWLRGDSVRGGEFEVGAQEHVHVEVGVQRRLATAGRWIADGSSSAATADRRRVQPRTPRSSRSARPRCRNRYGIDRWACSLNWCRPGRTANAAKAEHGRSEQRRPGLRWSRSVRR